MSGSSKNSDPPGESKALSATGSHDGFGDNELDVTGNIDGSVDPDQMDTGVHHALIEDRDSTGVETQEPGSLEFSVEQGSESIGSLNDKTGSVDHSVDEPTGRVSPGTQPRHSIATASNRLSQNPLPVPSTAPLRGVTGFEFQADSSGVASGAEPSRPISRPVSIAPAPTPSTPKPSPPAVESSAKPATSSESSSSMQSDLNTMSGWIRGRLTVVGGVALGRTWYLNRGQIVVGRDLQCNVVLDDSSISQRHCRILRDENGYRVVDLKSLNGTYVNDRLVDEQDLVDGDLVRVGEVTFKYTRVGTVHVERREANFGEQVISGILNLGATNQGLLFMGLVIFFSLMISSAMVRGLQWAPSLDSSAEAERWVQDARSAIEVRDWRRARDELAIAGALDAEMSGLDRLRALVNLSLIHI